MKMDPFSDIIESIKTLGRDDRRLQTLQRGWRNAAKVICADARSGRTGSDGVRDADADERSTEGKVLDLWAIHSGMRIRSWLTPQRSYI